jgi:hypothetical protein
MAWYDYVGGFWQVGATYAYHRWIEAQSPPPGPRPEGGAVPQTDEGSAVPLVYGRARVRAPVIAWIGNWLPSPAGPNNRFDYMVDMTFVVGVPFYGGAATLQQMYAGDFVLTLVGATDSNPLPGKTNSVSSNAFNVFGGPDGGGGIFGDVEFFDGRPDQQISDGLEDDAFHPFTQTEGSMTGARFASHPAGTGGVDATLIPGYRNQMVCTLWDWSIGGQPNFSSYSFDVRSLSTGSASDLGRSLADDADPAAVIYDLLTSPWAKLGFPVEKIDRPSFEAVSLTLFTERHGYSRAIEQLDDASNLINDVLKQIDGLFYEEPTTGKIVLRLVRSDYDVNGLDDVNPDNATLQSYAVQGWNETINQVRLKFTDRPNNYADGLSIAQDGANATAQPGRGVRSMDVTMPGCCSSELAVRLASRELAFASLPTVRATVVVDRSFQARRPGDVVTFTWPELSITKMVMRIARMNLGQLHAGAITLDLIRDVFDQTLGAFPAP